jgi:hypothetical protein
MHKANAAIGDIIGDAASLKRAMAGLLGMSLAFFVVATSASLTHGYVNFFFFSCAIVF